MVDEWVKILPEYKKMYPSKKRGQQGNHQACIAIARDYKVNPATVYNKLTPKLKKQPIKKQEHRRKYSVKHEQLRRHIPDVLAEVYKGEFELPTNKIITRIANFSDIYIRESTLEKLLNRYNNHPEGKPLIESEPKKYVLNGNFYASQKKHQKYRTKALKAIQA